MCREGLGGFLLTPPPSAVSTVMLTSNLPPVTCTSNCSVIMGVILDIKGPNLHCQIGKMNKTHTYPNDKIHYRIGFNYQK